MSVIFTIRYPNDKIHIGQDRTYNINYFGSANQTTDFLNPKQPGSDVIFQEIKEGG